MYIYIYINQTLHPSGKYGALILRIGFCRDLGADSGFLRAAQARRIGTGGGNGHEKHAEGDVEGLEQGFWWGPLACTKTIMMITKTLTLHKNPILGN